MDCVVRVSVQLGELLRLNHDVAPEAAERNGLEGIVSKRQPSAYRSGPSRAAIRTPSLVARLRNLNMRRDIFGGADDTNRSVARLSERPYR